MATMEVLALKKSYPPPAPSPPPVDSTSHSCNSLSSLDLDLVIGSFLSSIIGSVHYNIHKLTRNDTFNWHDTTYASILIFYSSQLVIKHLIISALVHD